jgi:carotenoid cleavage dioxygenase
MGVSFAADPTAVGFFTPTRFEADIYDCEVEGKIPSELNGTFYRACTDRQYPKLYQNDNILNADGAIDMFRFQNGHVDFKTRFVRTERFLEERKARKSLYGLYRNKYTSEPAVRAKSHNTANTTPVYHGGKLFMLKESEAPTVIDPHTLETRGSWNFGGKLNSVSFTAHPKIDAVTGEMIAFGYEAAGDNSKDIAIYWINPKGEITRSVRVFTPYVSEMHDWAVSDKHLLIPTTGMVTSEAWVKAGNPYWGFDPRIPVFVGIMPRDGDAKDMRWFKVPPRHAMIHTTNAVTEGNKVHLYGPVTKHPYLGLFPTVDGSPANPADSGNNLRRWTFDLSKREDNAFSEEILYDMAGTSFSRVDDRYMTHPFQRSYWSYTDPARPFDEARGGNLRGRVVNCYACVDHARGGMKTFFAGETHSLEEPQFVPRRRDSPEGDGFLIGVARNFAGMYSEVVIADAMRPEEGALARVKLPFRLHGQVHGWWVSHAELPFA